MTLNKQLKAWRNFRFIWKYIDFQLEFPNSNCHSFILENEGHCENDQECETGLHCEKESCPFQIGYMQANCCERKKGS